jgi:branched-chain amino acid transport system permease protein
MKYVPYAAAAIFVAAVGLVPLALSDFQASQFAYVAIFLIAICGLNILTGYTGQISLGHGAFMAIGGYTTAILAAKEGVHYGWTIPCAAIVAGAAGFLVGIPALRLSGLYLAIATFGIAVAVPAMLKEFEGLTGGSSGLGFGLLRGPAGLTPNDWLYYLSWGIALFLLLCAVLLVRSPIGRTFRAVRDSEVAATTFGVNLAVYKTLAFAVSAAYAGVAGSLYALASLSYVSPETYKPQLSVLLVVGVVVAGLGSLWGLVVGAALLEFLQIHTGDIVDGLNWIFHADLNPKSAGVPDVIFGAVLVLVVILLPGGASTLIRRAVTLGRRGS